MRRTASDQRAKRWLGSGAALALNEHGEQIRARPPGRRSARCGRATAGRSCSTARRASGSAPTARSAAIGPPAGSPAAIALERLADAARTSAGRSPGDERGQRAPRRARCARRGSRSGRQNSTTPALTRSPRSTRGTTRSDRVLEGSRAGHARPPVTNSRGAREPRRADIRRTARPSRPRVRDQRGGASRGRPAAPAARRPPGSSRRRAAARGRGSPGTAAARTASGSPRRGGRYSDAPWSISHRLPCQRSMFGLRGVRSTFATSASSHTTSAASSASGGRSGEYGSAPGRKSTPRFEPALASIRSWISGSGSARAERRVEVDEHQLRDRQPEPAGQLAGHDLRRQRLRPLPRAAELEHVQPVVVGLHERGQRPALAQGRHVAGGGHRAQHGCHDARAMPTLSVGAARGAGRAGRDDPLHARARIRRLRVAVAVVGRRSRRLLGRRSGTSSASRGRYDRVLAVARDAGRAVVPGRRASTTPSTLFRGKADDAVAIVHASELRELSELDVGRAAPADGEHDRAGLRALGVERGDRVGGLHAEHPGGDRRVPGVRVDRRRLVELLARLRRRAR